ncbi:uncharacterized protein LOC121051203 [Rosa chinensis]|uniref:uncharacterized protein LOC121051203 n=1 Tax=Rosa chinensis TaxID=74649 RepID=UPI001AD93C7B|nr:uncharacterized protein LOC121051203 [Rosa chinensis]
MTCKTIRTGALSRSKDFTAAKISSGVGIRELEKEVKQGYCVHCKKDFPDIEGHHKVLHDRKVMRCDEGKLFHCPICLPEAALFIDADALFNHLNDYQHKEAK